MNEILEQYSLRCPECKSTRITSDNNREHLCLDCNASFNDEQAMRRTPEKVLHV